MRYRVNTNSQFFNFNCIYIYIFINVRAYFNDYFLQNSNLGVGSGTLIRYNGDNLGCKWAISTKVTPTTLVFSPNMLCYFHLKYFSFSHRSIYFLDYFASLLALLVWPFPIITHVIFIFIPHVQSFIVALQKMYDFMWKQIVPPLMGEQFSVSIIPCKFVCYDSYRSAMKSGRLAN